MLFKNNHDSTFTDIAVVAGCAYNDDGHEQAGMGVGVADYDFSSSGSTFSRPTSQTTPATCIHNGNDGTFSISFIQFGRRHQQ